MELISNGTSIGLLGRDEQPDPRHLYSMDTELNGSYSQIRLRRIVELLISVLYPLVPSTLASYGWFDLRLLQGLILGNSLGHDGFYFRLYSYEQFERAVEKGKRTMRHLRVSSLQARWR